MSKIPVSYDITKDGVTVAVLTFPKGAFQLGETVNGMVEVNWREGRGHALQLTARGARVAAAGTRPPPPSTSATEHYLRRMHAEHRARFVLGTRLGFALRPDMGELKWYVRLHLLMGVASTENNAGTESRGVWGSAWRVPARLGVHDDETNRPIWKYQESAYGNFPNRGSSAAASLTTTATTSTPNEGTIRRRQPPMQHDSSAPALSSSAPIRTRALTLTHRHSRPPPSFLWDIATAWARIQGTTQIAYVRKDIRHTHRRTPTPVDVEVLTELHLRPSSDRRLRT
ncbi:hypothetical protein FB451DRAFT_1415612 [Mycena latifolia]|nr:hypothetical protein FB451DRAFT_1415612 [Mycena latifolia]